MCLQEIQSWEFFKDGNNFAPKLSGRYDVLGGKRA
jgi:hypothetical protein